MLEYQQENLAKEATLSLLYKAMMAWFYLVIYLLYKQFF